jgi:hypothetical protein
MCNLTLLAFTAVLGFAGSAASATEKLELAWRIALPDGKGRIDHLAYDALGERLFVAELGNNSVAVVDVKTRKLERRLHGFREPQGIAYFSEMHRLYVANGGDGSVVAYDARTFKPLHGRKLSGDADNIRIDAIESRIYVGYGEGALALLDAASLEPIGEIRLKGHPESFQLSPVDRYVYVNVPGARQIAVVDRDSREVAGWQMQRWSANYPMAIDTAGKSVLSVFRNPPAIAAYSVEGGALIAHVDVCGDADDLFIDEKRDRVYVICGEGLVDVLDRESLSRLDRIPTSPGSRTGLFSSAADTLFVAAPAAGGSSAAVWALKPR